jgi:putative ABC transport system permease protein
MTVTGVVVEEDEHAVPSEPAGVTRRSAVWPGVRLAARLARRELRRRPARTALMALLVAIPVAAMIVASVVARTAVVTGAEVWSQRNGAADAVPLSGHAPPPDLPAGSHQVQIHQVDGAALRTATGQRAVARITDAPLDAPITSGLVKLTTGRPPAGPDEVLLSPDLADELGVGVGSGLALERPERMSVTVSGLGVDTDEVRMPLLVVGPGRTLPMLASTDPTTLIDLPSDLSRQEMEFVAWKQQLALSPDFGRGEIADDEPRDTSGKTTLIAVLVGSLALTAAGIVIAAAFASGARRQLAAVGLLSANGTPPALIRRTMVYQGVATGLLGLAAALGLAGLVLAIGRSRLDVVFRSWHDGYQWRPTDVLIIGALGVAVATVAAAVPARAIARVPTLAALNGRRPAGAVPRGLTLAGLAAFAGGVAAVVAATRAGRTTDALAWIVLTAGAQAVLLGMVAMTPAVVSGLERATGRLSGPSGRLRGPWRLAARSLARQRTHSTAMVAAVCACAALTLAASAYVVGARFTGLRAPEPPPDSVVLEVSDSQEGAPLSPVPAEALAVARAELPEATVTGLTHARPAAANDEVTILPISLSPGQTPTVMWGPLLVANDDALSVVGLSDHARHRLAEAGTLAVGVEDGRARAAIIERADSRLGVTESQIRVPFDVAVVGVEDAPYLNAWLITPERAHELNLVTGPGPVVLRMPGPLDDGQRAAVATMRADPAWPKDVMTSTGTPATIRRGVLVEAGLGIASLIVTLLVIAVGLALASAESRTERDLLAVAGADPRTLARVTARKAALIVVLGTWLAVPVGLIPAVLALGITPATGIPVPTRTLVLLLVVVPVVAGFVTRVGSAVAQWRRPLRWSTATFE